MSRPAATIEIEAPIELVWDVMLDVDRYPDWNPFVVRAETASPPRVGNPITLHVRWANGKGTVSPERISVIEPPHEGSARLSYVYEGWPSRLGLVRGTREQRLTSTGTGTRYDTVEFFSGPLVALAGPGRVADGFRRHAEALKAGRVPRAVNWLRPCPGEDLPHRHGRRLGCRRARRGVPDLHPGQGARRGGLHPRSAS